MHIGFDTSSADVNHADPEALDGDVAALEDREDELLDELLLIRQKKRRLLRARSAPAVWLDGAAVERIYKIKMPTVTAAARRGELEIGRAGRSPRVRRDVLDAWIATRKHPLARPLPAAVQDDAASQYDAIVARSR